MVVFLGFSGVLLIVAFCFFLFIAYDKTSQIVLGVGLLIAIIGMFPGISSYSPLIVIIYDIVLLAGIVLAIMGRNQIKTKEQTAKELENRNKELIGFYDECVKNRISSITPHTSEKDIQKVTLIAQKHGLDASDITGLYYKGKVKKDKIEQQLAEKALEAERTKEKKLQSELMRYSGYTGREKRIAMLTAERDEHKNAADTLIAGAAAIMQTSQFKEKESNWGTVGGIASAIGGPGAGVAAALEDQVRTERENAQIRAQNKKNKEYFAPVVNTSMNGAADHRSAARRLDKLIDEAKTKLVADDSAAECFSRIKFKNTKVAVAKTGTCTVTTTASVKPFMIFDDVPAVVDGTVIADIYENDNLIGTAEMVLPVYGAGENTSLTGMALSCGQTDGKFTVKFRYKNLWAMEK